MSSLASLNTITVLAINIATIKVEIENPLDSISAFAFVFGSSKSLSLSIAARFPVFTDLTTCLMMLVISNLGTG